MKSSSRVPQPYLILWGSGVALSCALDGQVLAEELHGLFAGDTRVLSTYQVLISGQTWRLLGRSHFGHGTAQWEYQNRPLRDAVGEIPAGTLLLTLDDALIARCTTTCICRLSESALLSYSSRCNWMRTSPISSK